MRIGLVLLVLWAALATPALAERRVALVVGNDVYANLPAGEQLRNAVNDANAVKRALESLNFEVDLGTNLDRNQFIDKITDFAAKIEPGDVAFFFYAGHGVAFNGASYLLPGDVPAPRAEGRREEDRIADRAISEQSIFERIGLARPRVAVVVLDACRNNPLTAGGTRALGGSRGLQRPPETRGILTIYSAGEGQTASDGSDGDSLFSGVFVKQLTTPGLGLRELAFRTQSEVARLANDAGVVQEPGVYSQIIGEDVYLAGPPKTAGADAAYDALIAGSNDAAFLTTLAASLPEGPAKARAQARAKELEGRQAATGTERRPSQVKNEEARAVMDDFFKRVEAEAANRRRSAPTPGPAQFGNDGERLAMSNAGDLASAPGPVKALGMTLSVVDPGAQRAYHLKDDMKGLVVTSVDANSIAANKGLKAGDVIIECRQQLLRDPSDLLAALDAEKKQGHRAILLLVRNPVNGTRFVVFPTQ